MGNKLKLSKIEITTKDGKTVALSLEEAKDLHAQLDELLGSKTVFVPQTPIVIERERWPYWSPYQPVWCGSTGKTDDYARVTCTADSGLAVSYCGCEA